MYLLQLIIYSLARRNVYPNSSLYSIYGHDVIPNNRYLILALLYLKLNDCALHDDGVPISA